MKAKNNAKISVFRWALTFFIFFFTPPFLMVAYADQVYDRIGYMSEYENCDPIVRAESPSLYDRMRLRRENQRRERQLMRFRKQRLNNLYNGCNCYYQEAGGTGACSSCPDPSCPDCPFKLVPPEVEQVLENDRRYR